MSEKPPFTSRLWTLTWQCAVAGFLIFALFGQTHINPDQINMSVSGSGAVIRCEALVSQSPDGSYMLPIPVPPPTTNQAFTVTLWAITVARNNVQQNAGKDFNMDPTNSFRFIPATPWLPTDTVVADYWSGVRGPQTLATTRPIGKPKPMIKNLFGRFLTREYPAK
jgi:hypothetical protein